MTVKLRVIFSSSYAIYIVMTLSDMHTGYQRLVNLTTGRYTRILNGTWWYNVHGPKGGQT